MLRIATKYAKAGNKGGVQVVVGEIRLSGEHFGDPRTLRNYDFAKPETWCVVYEPSITMASLGYAIGLAGEVAAASMTLQQTLHNQPDA